MSLHDDAFANPGIDLGSARHLENTSGQSRVWLAIGPHAWPRGPSAFKQSLSTQLALGYGYEVGHARLAWQILLVDDLKADGRRFLSIDLLSIERSYFSGSLKPYYRFALAAATDLNGPKATFGEPKFYNQENGTTGGFGLRAGVGLDWDLGSTLFTRSDFGLALYGGVGRVSTPFSATFALGFRID
ncbi:MAG: hypothetical protein VYA30_00680 [Myxococcota bacterium]|nr:hypothetical protein [Myxococcota bacterium]